MWWIRKTQFLKNVLADFEILITGNQDYFLLPQCMSQLVNEAPFMYTSELETVSSLCFRALDGSNYDVRCAVAKLLGNLMSTTQSPKAVNTGKDN